MLKVTTRSKVIYIIASLFFIFPSQAQIERQAAEAVMDHAIKYEQKEREKREAEFTRKISGGIGRSQASDVLSVLGWMLGLSVIGSVGWFIYREWNSGKQENPDKYAAMERKFRPHLVSCLDGLSSTQVREMTLEQLMKRVNVDIATVQVALTTLKWKCADYDGEAENLRYWMNKGKQW